LGQHDETLRGDERITSAEMTPSGEMCIDGEAPCGSLRVMRRGLGVRRNGSTDVGGGVSAGYYDPVDGRFLSPDPILGHLTVP